MKNLIYLTLIILFFVIIHIQGVKPIYCIEKAKYTIDTIYQDNVGIALPEIIQVKIPEKFHKGRTIEKDYIELKTIGKRYFKTYVLIHYNQNCDSATFNWHRYEHGHYFPNEYFLLLKNSFNQKYKMIKDEKFILFFNNSYSFKMKIKE